MEIQESVILTLEITVTAFSTPISVSESLTVTQSFRHPCEAGPDLGAQGRKFSNPSSLGIRGGY